MAQPQQQGVYGQQQYGGYQRPGQYGGYGGPPPKKGNSGVIAVVIVLVAALAGLGITGFVAPGFFLGDDGGSSSGGGAGSEVEQFAGALVGAADEQDKSALSGFKCADATDSVDEAINLIGQTDGAELMETREVSADEHVAVIAISYQGQQAPFAATVVRAANDWCWQDFEPGNGGSAGGTDSGPAGGPDSGPGAPSDGSANAEAEAFVEEFLGAVNAKNAAEAEGMICSDTPSNSLVEYVIGKNPQLELGEVDRPGSSYVSYELDGTVDGKPLNTGRVSVRVTGGGSPCVFTFIAG